MTPIIKGLIALGTPASKGVEDALQAENEQLRREHDVMSRMLKNAEDQVRAAKAEPKVKT
jgi:hypothetical protein